jgi:hypothetical protein
MTLADRILFSKKDPVFFYRIFFAAGWRANWKSFSNRVFDEIANDDGRPDPLCHCYYLLTED